MDLNRIPIASRALFKAVLRSQQRYTLALAKVPNLGPLERTEQPSPIRGFDQYPPAVQTLLQTPPLISRACYLHDVLRFDEKA